MIPMNICKPIINKLIWNPLRSITYLHSGSRVRGLKKDPVVYMKNPVGLSYIGLKTEEHQQTVRKTLNFEKYNIEMNDDLLLQCFTHKSFAHGSKPYNEKLSLLGSQFLKYQASIYSINQKEQLGMTSKNNIQNTVNSLNFTNLGTKFSKFLISTVTLSDFIKSKKLNTLIFWKMRDPLNKDLKSSGESTVCSSVLNALIGGMLITNGPQKTTQFINDELLDKESETSLIKLANEYVQEKPL